MRALRTLAVGCCAFLAQSALAHLGLPPYLIPQLVLLVVIQSAFAQGNVVGVCVAFLLGLVVDVSSAVLIGPWAGAFVTVYAALTMLSRGFFVDSTFVTMIMSCVSTVVAGVFFSFVSPHSNLTSVSDVGTLFGHAITTALIAPWLLGRFASMTERRSSAFGGVSPLSPA
jgi:rod shape-determining protein MreD